jgi:hypothetical protein
MVNFDLVTGWLKRCDATHEHTTDPSKSTPEFQGLRFIDTRNLCVVEQSYHVRFAALSYTWGRGEQYSLKRENVEFLKEFNALKRTKVAPKQVIIDAIEVCVKADIPYLWVDALCIIQDDAEGKITQIQNMNHIYPNAYITIIAAAEQKTVVVEGHLDKAVDLWLARVSTPIIPAEASFTIDDVSYLTGPDDFYQTLNTNFAATKWFSRAW